MKKLLLLSFLCPLFLIAQTQIGQDIDGEAAFDSSGWSVSLSSDGSIVAIGAQANDGNGSASGHVRVYENTGGTWVQIGQDIDGEAALDFSGGSLSLSSGGSVVAIGALGNDGNGSSSGHVRIYQNTGGTWVQIGNDIDGEIAGDNSGITVSLSSDGSIVAIGAQGNEISYVRIYSNTGGVWTQIGQDIDGEAAGDSSYSVSLSSDGSIVAIGAQGNDGNGSASGHVRVYENTGGTWVQIGQDIDGEAADDRSGSFISLSSDGSIVAIGALQQNTTNPGYVRVYSNTGGVWTQVGQDIDGEADFDLSGRVSLSSDGSIVAIGAERNDGNGNNSGHVRIYSNTGGVWTQVGQDIDGEADFDESGRISLSSDGSIVAIGATGNDGNGDGSGHVRIFDLSALLSSDEFVLSQFSIYPNPAKTRVTIDLKAGLELEEVLIYNNLGQQIMTSKNLVIDTSSLNSGLYYLQIKTDKGNGTKKLIIE